MAPNSTPPKQQTAERAEQPIAPGRGAWRQNKLREAERLVPVVPVPADRRADVRRYVEDVVDPPVFLRLVALGRLIDAAEEVRQLAGSADLLSVDLGVALDGLGQPRDRVCRLLHRLERLLQVAADAARAKAEGAEIHWGDESGLRSDDVRGRGFAPKGQTPVIRVNNKRHGLSVISTVTNKGQMRWKIFAGALNADILIDFLRRLIKNQTKKVFLILDNLRVHHSRLVKAWLLAHAEAIEVFYLPSYSPELNPNEMANADLKQAVTKLAPARTKLQLVKATARHLSSIQRQPERIKSYFQHEPVRYAA